MEKEKLSLQYEIRPPLKGSDNPPVLFMLHGYGSNEQDLFSMAPLLSPQFAIISMRAPISLPWGGYAWYEINFNDVESKMSNVQQAQKSLQIISHFVDEALEAYAWQKSSVWLMGFSQGSILSYALSFSFPDKIHKVIAMSGYMFNDIMPGKPDIAKLQQMDFFVSHGTMDDILPVQWGRAAVEKLKALSIPHNYREYPEGHGVSQDNFGDMKAWIEKNIK